MKQNYHKLFLEEIDLINKSDSKKRLLVHTCCAPCSTHTLNILSQYFEITVAYYNPNIHPKNEYEKRYEEQKNYLKKADSNIKLLPVDYDVNSYFEAVQGLEKLGERSVRCDSCFDFRMDYIAKLAKDNNFDYFTTSLTISPMKSTESINQSMLKAAKKYGVKCLLSDFKKEDGYKKSLILSKEHDLYRQEYCGCVFSKQERDEYHKSKLNNDD